MHKPENTVKERVAKVEDLENKTLAEISALIGASISAVHIAMKASGLPFKRLISGWSNANSSDSPSNEVETFQFLWVAVIEQAYKDLHSDDPIVRDSAKHWFLSTTNTANSFVSICDLLGICRKSFLRRVFDEGKGKIHEGDGKRRQVPAQQKNVVVSQVSHN